MWIDSWGLIGWIGMVGCILMDFDELDWRGDGGVGWTLLHIIVAGGRRGL